MRRKGLLLGVAVAIVMLVAVSLRWRRATGTVAGPASSDPRSSPPVQRAADALYSEPQTNASGDTLLTAQDLEFVTRIFPKFREFIGTLERLSISPFEAEVHATSCSKIRMIHVPNGFICPFVIGDDWTAEYTRLGSFEGITHFLRRGPDNPFRAISHADTNALSRLSQRAVAMPEAEAWKIAEQVANAFAIDRARFEPPRMHEEALFEYRLGMHTVRYLAKGADPLNQLNYKRSFTIRATSPTTAVLVRYSNMDVR